MHYLIFFDFLCIVLVIGDPCSSLHFKFLSYFDPWIVLLYLHLVLGTWYIVPLQEGMLSILTKATTIFVDWVLHINIPQCHSYYWAWYLFIFVSPLLNLARFCGNYVNSILSLSLIPTDFPHNPSAIKTCVLFIVP